MITAKAKQEYYQALLAKNPEYEGVFYAGVKTTGVFCRPTCPARKPKFDHCEFFENAQQALFASFRPCQRCRPLSQFRAVAQANGANQLALVIPCHRIVRTSGDWEVMGVA